MMWLAQQMTLWLGLSFALGFVTSLVLSVRRVTVQRWEEVPPEPVAQPVEADAELHDETVEESPDEVADAHSPFPTLEGADDPAPWEQDELWSRPTAKVASARASQGPADEWDEAASNWRTWAEEAAGRATDQAEQDHDATADDEVASAAHGGGGRFGADRGAARPSDDELFAQDREPMPVDDPPVPSFGGQDEAAESWSVGRDEAAGQSSPFPSFDEDWSTPSGLPSREEQPQAETQVFPDVFPVPVDLPDDEGAQDDGRRAAADEAAPQRLEGASPLDEDTTGPGVRTSAEPEPEPEPQAVPEPEAEAEAEAEDDPEPAPVASVPAESRRFGPEGYTSTGGGSARPFRRKRRSELLRDRQEHETAPHPAFGSVASSSRASGEVSSEDRADATSAPDAAPGYDSEAAPAREEQSSVGDAAPWADEPAEHRPESELQADVDDVVTEQVIEQVIEHAEASSPSVRMGDEGTEGFSLEGSSPWLVDETTVAEDPAADAADAADAAEPNQTQPAGVDEPLLAEVEPDVAVEPEAHAGSAAQPVDEETSEPWAASAEEVEPALDLDAPVELGSEEDEGASERQSLTEVEPTSAVEAGTGATTAGDGPSWAVVEPGHDLEPQVDAVPEVEPEPGYEVETEVETEVAAQMESAVHAEPFAHVEPAAAAERWVEPATGVERDPWAEPVEPAEVEAEAEAEPAVEHESVIGVDAESLDEVEPSAQAEVAAGEESELDVVVEPAAEMDPVVEPEPEPEPEPDTDLEPDVEPEHVAVTQPEPEPASSANTEPPTDEPSTDEPQEETRSGLGALARSLRRKRRGESSRGREHEAARPAYAPPAASLAVPGTAQDEPSKEPGQSSNGEASAESAAETESSAAPVDEVEDDDQPLEVADLAEPETASESSEAAEPPNGRVGWAEAQPEDVEPTDEVLVPDADGLEDAVLDVAPVEQSAPELDPEPEPEPEQPAMSVGWADPLVELPTGGQPDDVLVPDAETAADAVVEQTPDVGSFAEPGADPDVADWDGSGESRSEEPPFPLLTDDAPTAETAWSRDDEPDAHASDLLDVDDRTSEPEQQVGSLGWAELPAAESVEEPADDVLVPDAEAAADAVVEQTPDVEPYAEPVAGPVGPDWDEVPETAWSRDEEPAEAAEAIAEDRMPEPESGLDPEPEPMQDLVPDALWARRDQPHTDGDFEGVHDEVAGFDFSNGLPRPYGSGSAFAPADGTVPLGYAIKGQRSTMLFYPRTARFYTRVAADVYFDTEESAERAGFIRFDRRSSTAHVSLRPENLR